MSLLEIWYTRCMYWHRHRLIRPLDVFNFPLYFCSSQNFHCLLDKQCALRAPTYAARRRWGVVKTVLPLIPVSYLFAQPAKMVWITNYDQVLYLTSHLVCILFWNDFILPVATFCHV